MEGEEARSAGRWPASTAVLRVTAGWFLAGIGALNLAVEMDGGLTPRYAVFHVVLLCGGMLLLTRWRLRPSRTGAVLAAVVMAVGLWVGLPYSFPPAKWLAVDLVFWGCVALLLVTAAGLAEQWLPERRTPVDVSAWSGHAEPEPMAATPDRTGENVGGLP